MKVEMLVNTRNASGPLKKGDKLEVSQIVADRWIKNGIAKVVKTTTAAPKEPKKED